MKTPKSSSYLSLLEPSSRFKSPTYQRSPLRTLTHLKKSTLILLLGLVCFTAGIKAQEDESGQNPSPNGPPIFDSNDNINELAEIAIALPPPDLVEADKIRRQNVIAKYGHSDFKVEVDSIEPEGGPTTGNTRVLVRGGPFTDLQLIFPKPKCKFGKNDLIVDATYVLCTTSPTATEEVEARHRQKNDTCLQCDNNPEVSDAQIVPFTVSLIGDFSDSTNSLPFRYYKPTRVFAIYPRYGPKDGQTFVQVWGENFLNFDENTRCNFGSKSVVAHFVSSNYLTCISPFSDVVEKAIPFSVSLNKQQNSRDKIDYWYYNWPMVAELVPNYGPDSGGNKVLVKGNNFQPFVAEDIDNYNDTFCEFEGIAKVQAYPINSTKLYCYAPPNYILDQTIVEVTLNNQQYTDDNVPYFYYRPPQVFDIEPKEGETKGGTNVILFGNNFKDSKNITCKFGGKITRGTFIDTNRISCVSPPAERAGYVPVTVSYEGERYSSESNQFLYYETPEIYNITPTCGPVTGYTQITLFGKNFIDMGFDKVKCIFNGTYYMNATIMEENIIKCDSPPLPPSLGFSDASGAPYFYISLTLNGRDISNTRIKFIYYIDPSIKSITPFLGPMKGGTISTIRGSGFAQEGVCNVTVRYGQYQQKLKNYTDTELVVSSPPAQVPDAIVVSVALNGQQFVNDKTLHFRDEENTFIYYQEMFILESNPKAGPTTGKTVLKVEGLGFQQFKNDDGTIKDVPLYARFRDQATGQIIGGNATKAFDVSDDQFFWSTPAAEIDTKAMLEVSYNLYDWQMVPQKGKNYSFVYYTAPKITSITPPYGPVKSPNNESIEIIGKNFQCPDTDCNVWVRFGDPDNAIIVKAVKEGDDRFRVMVPKFTKPDVLPVEISFNGVDFTHDNYTYGFFDPYVLDIQPRLISPKGTTKVRFKGFGFVNTNDLKAKFMTSPKNAKNGVLTCSGVSDCVVQAEYIDKETLEIQTLPQSSLYYKESGQNIMSNPFVAEASVLNNIYTQNNIELWYYELPDFHNVTTTLPGTPSNLEKPIFIKTNFKWSENSYEKFSKYANLTCRFTSLDGKRQVVTLARMEIYPLGSYQDDGALPDHIRCASPPWSGSEEVKIDFSMNGGHDYSGDFSFTFYEALDLYRIVPMAGPLLGNTRVKLYGSGFTGTKDDIYVRWGVLETEKQNKALVLDYIWSENDFIQNAMVPGSEILPGYKKEAYNIPKKDAEITEGRTLRTYVAHAPKLFNWNRTHGGPIYLAVGQNIFVNATSRTFEEGPDGEKIPVTRYEDKTIYKYSQAFVEYYYYVQPTVKRITPNSGLTRGGTIVEVAGSGFIYRPEYGMIPHCKFGDKVVRAQYHSTVRITCVSVPNYDINSLQRVQVSQNGVDFIDTGINFRYYEQPILYKMSPTCGPESGGTQIYITGSKFSNISDPATFNCRFTSQDQDIPPKYIPAFYENQTTIMCSSPGGWGRGDSVRVQLTFNGEDYSDNNFTFNYYNIIRAFPRSGPSDGSGGPIRIEGSGFTNNTEIYCSLDKTLYEPLRIAPDVIECPMMKAKQGNNFFGAVDFAIIIDGNWHKFTGGFQYYEQVILDDVYPKTGPAEGKGVIYFYGKNFRDDYSLSEVGCKVGDAVGKGRVVNPTTIKCVVEEMALVDEGYSLPISVALNSYSWADTNQTFVPYGVTGIYPNAGSSIGSTDILITGKGFSEELAEKAKCRFGINADFAIVDAEVLSYDKMICRSPPDFKFPPNSGNVLSVPLGIGFGDEEYEPWTESIHRFRFYKPPNLVRAEPDEVYVGRMAEVYIFADEESEFWEPIPTGRGQLGQYGIECKFGRFGVGVGVFVNKTTIKCVTPSVSDDPESIWKETVKLTVAMNGQDFDEDTSDIDFTFIGQGSTLVFWPYVIGTLLIGLLLVALIVFCSALLQKASFEKVVAFNVKQRKERPYVIRDPFDQFTSRAYSAGQMGRMSPNAQERR